MDSYLADFWNRCFPTCRVHGDIALRTRQPGRGHQEQPKLKAALDGFIAKNGLDSAVGAVLNKRYLQSTKFVKNATSGRRAQEVPSP